VLRLDSHSQHAHIHPPTKIGGSVPLLKDSLGRVCKPAAQAEKAFYEELPSVYPFLVKYTPAYYGCCTVNVRRVLRDISAHLENYHTNHTPRVYPDGTASTQTPVPVQKNWNAFQVRHKKMERDADGNVEFIMLEDLTRNHRYSNVLDIKLGSAQYSAQHDAARTKQMDPKQRAKMARAIEKCNNSTSHKYGFRVNGMQIYREDKQLYKVMDKFACRSLDISGTDRVLERFLKYPTWNNLDQLRTLIAVRIFLVVLLLRVALVLVVFVLVRGGGPDGYVFVPSKWRESGVGRKQPGRV
jgi:hypothetical protein